jgi:alpha-L-arabinofuranosidase
MKIPAFARAAFLIAGAAAIVAHLACSQPQQPTAQAPAPSASATVTVDATKTGAPISKYIYGQFIEHLGRCIYGGIWAEMLEDRKFFYPVTGEAPAWEMFTPGPRSWDGEGHPYELLTRSPWMIIGPKRGVKMVTPAYVGEHTPEIALPGRGQPAGLMQERLGLVADRDYTGRIVLSGAATAAPVDVSLVWGGGATMRHTVTIEKIGAEYATYPLRFRAGNSTDNGRLEIVARGTGAFRVGTVSLMPADNISGWRTDTVALLKELDSPVYRWPGGNFVSGYNWRDGIGDPDKRPPRKNPAWKGIEHNDVGIHEYMALMRELGAEPFIAVNTGLGDETARPRRRSAGCGPRTATRNRSACGGSPWATRCTATGNWATCRSPNT